MKNYYLTILLFTLATVFAFAGGPAPDIFIDTQNIVDGAISAIKVDASIAKQADVDAALGQLQADLSFGRRIYYCTTSTEVVDSITYGTLSETKPEMATSITFAAPDSTEWVQLATPRGRISPALGITTIQAGVYDRVSFMSNSNPSGRQVKIQYRLWRVDAAGTKIAQIATSSEGVIESLGETTIQRVATQYAISPAVTVAPTDRLMEEFWFKRSGTTSGPAPNITRYVGGNRAGYASFGIPGNVLMLTDGSNATEGVEFRRDHIQSTSVGRAENAALTLSNRANWGYGASLKFLTPLSSGGTATDTAMITGVWDSTNSGGLRFCTRRGGDWRRAVHIPSHGTVGINIDGPDIDTKLHVNGQVRVDGMYVYADNAAAISDGLAVGTLYRTPTGQLMIVYEP